MLSLNLTDWKSAVAADCGIWNSLQPEAVYWIPGTRIVGLRPWPFEEDPPEGLAILSAAVGGLGSLLLLLRFLRAGALWASNLTYLALASALFELGIARWTQLSSGLQIGVWMLLVFVAASLFGVLRIARQSSSVHAVSALLSIAASIVFFFVLFL